MKVVFFTWLWIYCSAVLTGPNVYSESDLTGDRDFDLQDVAEFQNGATVNELGKVGYKFCCCEDVCSPWTCVFVK